VNTTEIIDDIIDDLSRVHVIMNAETGHGKSSSTKTIIKRLKELEPKTIVKVFDVSQAWFHLAPLSHRQWIGVQTLVDFSHGKTTFTNLNDCVYEMGDLTEELRRFFVAIIIKQDYESRRAMAKQYGLKAVEKLPRIVYVFEESDCYFDSASLNKKDEASEKLRDFIKVGRNFGLRGFCICTAEVGELGTKLRRRSKHLIGKIISDSDQRFFNRKVKNMGNLALQLPRFHWIYYNGESVSEPFLIEDLVTETPKDYEITKSYPWKDLPKGEVARAESRRPTIDEPKDDYSVVKWILFLALLALAWVMFT